MTKFTALLTTLGRRRLLTAVQALGLWLIATVAATLINIFANRHAGSHEAWSMLVISWGFVLLMLAGVVLFCQLAVANEKVWTRAQYRLLPMSDAKLYLANKGATALAFVAFWVVGLAVTILFIAMSGQLKWLHFHASFWDVASVAILFLVMTLFFWALLSTDNLLVHTIRAFLPESRGGLLTGILYIVTIVAVLWVLHGLQKLILLPFGGSILSSNISDSVGYAAILIFGFITALLAALNIFLLKRFVEPKA
ncbi:hypothetical protein [Lacticaseibacillus sp. GG6-2]